MPPADSNITVVELDQTTLSAKNVAAFKTAMTPHITHGHRLILDLHLLDYIDSSGCGALVNLGRKLTLAGGGLKLCRITPSVRALFDLVRLHLVLDVYPSPAGAMQAFLDEESRPRR